MELLNYGLQYGIEKYVTSYATNLIIETEKPIKFLESYKTRNAWLLQDS